MHHDIVRILSNEWHVLDLRKNLISLSTLDSHGFKYFSKDRVSKILKDALIVLKGKLSHGLYLLQGSTIVGAASIYL